jgi:hypothetical protein
MQDDFFPFSLHTLMPADAISAVTNLIQHTAVHFLAQQAVLLLLLLSSL